MPSRDARKHAGRVYGDDDDAADARSSAYAGAPDAADAPDAVDAVADVGARLSCILFSS
jgi:hypothetical protein